MLSLKHPCFAYNSLFSFFLLLLLPITYFMRFKAILYFYTIYFSYIIQELYCFYYSIYLYNTLFSYIKANIKEVSSIVVERKKIKCFKISNYCFFKNPSNFFTKPLLLLLFFKYFFFFVFIYNCVVLL